jgi:hypothetical protein
MIGTSSVVGGKLDWRSRANMRSYDQRQLVKFLSTSPRLPFNFDVLIHLQNNIIHIEQLSYQYYASNLSLWFAPCNIIDSRAVLRWISVRIWIPTHTFKRQIWELYPSSLSISALTSWIVAMYRTTIPCRKGCLVIEDIVSSIFNLLAKQICNNTFISDRRWFIILVMCCYWSLISHLIHEYLSFQKLQPCWYHRLSLSSFFVLHTQFVLVPDNFTILSV